MQPGANSGGLLAIATLAIIFGTLAVALRLYTRKVILNQIWVDDYLALGSWVCLMALAVQNFHNISTGIGTHFADIPPQDLPAFFLDLWLGLLIYQVTLLFTKLTLFFQFYRIIRHTSWQRQKVFYVALMAIIAAWQIGQVFIQIFACNPVAKSWDFSISGTCQPVALMRVMNASANIVSDFIILVLPLPIIWRLELPLKQRLALGSIFCLGFFTCVIAILRVTLTTATETDVSWQTTDLVAWTTAEVMTGVIIAALSTLRPLLGRYMPGWTTKSSSTSGGASHRLKTFSSTITTNVDRKSSFITRSSRVSGGGWLDVEEAEQADLVGKYGGVSLRYPMPARLAPGMGRSLGSIRVTKEWSVEAKLARDTQSDMQEDPQEDHQEEASEPSGHHL